MIISVQKNRLFETVYEKMIELIEEGLWQEGTRIPGEIQLSQQFNVSRNSLRTAIKVLHTSEILESKPGLGTFVAADALIKIKNNRLLNMLQSEESLNEVLQVRYILDKEGAYTAAQVRTEKDLAGLEECIDNLKKAVSQKNIQNAVYWGSEFHSRIIRISGNKLLYSIYDSLKPRMLEEREEYLSANNFEEVYDEYIKKDEMLIDAIRNKDAELARDLMIDHVLIKKRGESK